MISQAHSSLLLRTRKLLSLLSTAFVLLAVASLWLPAGTHAQQATGPVVARPTDTRIPMTADTRNLFDDPSASDLDQKTIDLLNAKRQKKLTEDAQRLLRLTTELRAEISANPQGQSTSAELAKVAQIEKLAHTVQSRIIGP